MLQELIEVQRLKNLDRTGWSLRGLAPRTESVAAHSFGVGVVAMLLVDELASRGVKVNSERVLRMALLHDWAEARIGDMPKTASTYFGTGQRKRAELAAFSDIVSGLGASADLYRELYEDYEQRSSVEARLVKAADVIDLLVQVLTLERAGARGLDEFWEVAQAPNFSLDGPAEQIIAELMQELVKLRQEINQSAG